MPEAQDADVCAPGLPEVSEENNDQTQESRLQPTLDQMQLQALERPSRIRSASCIGESFDIEDVAGDGLSQHQSNRVGNDRKRCSGGVASLENRRKSMHARPDPTVDQCPQESARRRSVLTSLIPRDHTNQRPSAMSSGGSGASSRLLHRRSTVMGFETFALLPQVPEMETLSEASSSEHFSSSSSSSSSSSDDEVWEPGQPKRSRQNSVIARDSTLLKSTEASRMRELATFRRPSIGGHHTSAALRRRSSVMGFEATDMDRLRKSLAASSENGSSRRSSRVISQRSSEVVHLFSHECLRQVKVLASCSDECMARLMESVETKMTAPGCDVFCEGQEGTAIFFLIYGNAEVLKGTDRIAELTNGAIFGEMSLLTADDHRKRTATVRATTFLNLRFIERDALLHLLKPFPRCKDAFMAEARNHSAELKALSFSIQSNRKSRKHSVQQTMQSSHLDSSCSTGLWRRSSIIEFQTPICARPLHHFQDLSGRICEQDEKGEQDDQSENSGEGSDNESDAEACNGAGDPIDSQALGSAGDQSLEIVVDAKPCDVDTGESKHQGEDCAQHKSRISGNAKGVTSLYEGVCTIHSAQKNELASSENDSTRAEESTAAARSNSYTSFLEELGQECAQDGCTPSITDLTIGGSLKDSSQAIPSQSEAASACLSQERSFGHGMHRLRAKQQRLLPALSILSIKQIRCRPQARSAPKHISPHTPLQRIRRPLTLPSNVLAATGYCSTRHCSLEDLAMCNKSRDINQSTLGLNLLPHMLQHGPILASRQVLPPHVQSEIVARLPTLLTGNAARTQDMAAECASLPSPSASSSFSHAPPLPQFKVGDIFATEAAPDSISLDERRRSSVSEVSEWWCGDRRSSVASSHQSRRSSGSEWWSASRRSSAGSDLAVIPECSRH